MTDRPRPIVFRRDGDARSADGRRGFTTIIFVFVRAPQLGRVKTRLAAELGDELALAIYRDLGLRTYRTARAVPAADVIVACTPADSMAAVVSWLGNDARVIAQCNGNLGERMHDAAETGFAGGADRVVIVGADCPDLTASIIGDACNGLAEADIVLGPATDGGYYLIGMRRPAPELFTGIPWSTAHTLDATLGAASRAGLHVLLLSALADVDTADDWRRWCASSSHPE